MVKIVERMLRLGEGRTLKRLQGMADQVNALEEDFVRLTDAQLREETDTFRTRIADGESLEALLPEAFAGSQDLVEDRHQRESLSVLRACPWGGRTGRTAVEPPRAW